MCTSVQSMYSHNVSYCVQHLTLTSNFPDVMSLQNLLDPATLHRSPMFTKLVYWFTFIGSSPAAGQETILQATCCDLYPASPSWYGLRTAFQCHFCNNPSTKTSYSVDGLNVCNAIGVVLLHSGCYSQDIGVKDDVIGIEAHPFNKQLVGTLAYVCLAMARVSLEIHIL